MKGHCFFRQGRLFFVLGSLMCVSLCAQQPKKDTSSDTATDQEESAQKVGIDTVDLDEGQGNWLFKRTWWERAEKKYEKIRTTIDEIFDARMAFFSKRNVLDKQVLDPFYVSVGLGQGEFLEILTTLLDQMKLIEERDGELTEKERTFKERLLKEQETIAQLQRDVVALEQFDHEVDQVINKVLEQINTVRNYDAQAWDKFKNIARLLSDTKAREQYYEIDSLLRNVQSVKLYITQTLMTHLDQLIQQVQTQVKNVQQAVNAFKAQEIDFKNTADTIEKLSRFEFQEREQKRREERRKRLEQEQEEASLSVWQSVYKYTLGPVVTLVSYVGYVLVWPFKKIFGQQDLEE